MPCYRLTSRPTFVLLSGRHADDTEKEKAQVAKYPKGFSAFTRKIKVLFNLRKVMSKIDTNENSRACQLTDVTAALTQPKVARSDWNHFAVFDSETLAALESLYRALHDPSILDARRHIRHRLAPVAHAATPPGNVSTPIITITTFTFGPRSTRSGGGYIISPVINGPRIPPHPPAFAAAPSPADADHRILPSHPIVQPPRVMQTSDLSVVRFLGEGTNGRVYLVKDNISKVKMALKVIAKEGRNEYAMKAILKELNIQAKLSHSSWFVRMLASWHDTSFVYIAMSVYPTDLDSEMIRCNTLDPDRARFYMAEIMIALTELHKLGIIHRDLKAPNVLIDREGHIALADFGLSKDFHKLPSIAERVSQPYWPYLPDDNPTSATPPRDPSELQFVAWNYRGSEMEMAPEIHLRMPYSFGVDFWSAAVVLFWMLTARPPWYEDDEEDYEDEDSDDCKPLAYKIAEDPIDWLPTDDVDDITKDFLEKMLRKEPKKRLMIEYEMPHHPYFAGINWTLMEKRLVPPPWVPGDVISHVYEPTTPTFVPGDVYAPGEDPMPEFVFNVGEVQNRTLAPADAPEVEPEIEDDTSETETVNETETHDTEQEEPAVTTGSPIDTAGSPTDDDSISIVTCVSDVLEDEMEMRELWDITLINPPPTRPSGPGPKSWIQIQDILQHRSHHLDTPAAGGRERPDSASTPSTLVNSSFGSVPLPCVTTVVHHNDHNAKVCDISRPTVDPESTLPTLPNANGPMLNGRGIIFKLKVWLWQLWKPRPKRGERLKRLSLIPG